MQDCKHSDLDALFARLALNKHRQLILLCGSQQWAAAQLNEITHSLLNGLALSNSNHFEHACWPEHLHQILGQEFDYAVYDAYSGIIPNKLAALSGTVKAGGALFLVLPELTALGDWLDPAIEIWQSQEQVIQTSYFLKRWQRLLSGLPISVLSQSSTAQVYLPVKLPIANTALEYLEQQCTVQTICQKLTSKKPQPILLSADRGRGKSASLGLIAAALPEQQFILCSRQYQIGRASCRERVYAPV